MADTSSTDLGLWWLRTLAYVVFTLWAVLMLELVLELGTLIERATHECPSVTVERVPTGKPTVIGQRWPKSDRAALR
jgi:hypothetical protein